MKENEIKEWLEIIYHDIDKIEPLILKLIKGH
jgi:hypothetical protein